MSPYLVYNHGKHPIDVANTKTSLVTKSFGLDAIVGGAGNAKVNDGDDESKNAYTNHGEKGLNSVILACHRICCDGGEMA